MQWWFFFCWSFVLSSLWKNSYYFLINAANNVWRVHYHNPSLLSSKMGAIKANVKHFHFYALFKKMNSFILILAVCAITISAAASESSLPQGCVEVVNTYSNSNHGIDFSANATFSIHPVNKFVMASNVVVTYSVKDVSQRLCLVSDTNSSVCVSDFTSPIGVPVVNATFLFKATFSNASSTTEFIFASGVHDEGSFSFPTGTLFSPETPCASIVNNGEFLSLNLDQRFFFGLWSSSTAVRSHLRISENANFWAYLFFRGKDSKISSNLLPFFEAIKKPRGIHAF